MSMIDTLQGVIKGRDFAQLKSAEREEVARDLVRSSAFASAALVAVPIPLSELLLTTPVNIAMLVGLGRIYGKPLSKSEAGELLAELLAAAGGSVVASRLWISVSKIILPGLGVYLFIPYVYAVTWAIGRIAMLYFSDGDASDASFKDRFQSFIDEGKRAFSYRAFRNFVRRHGEEVKRSAAEENQAGANDSSVEPDGAQVRDEKGQQNKTTNATAPIVEADWGEVVDDPGHELKVQETDPLSKSATQEATDKKAAPKKATSKKTTSKKATSKKATSKKATSKKAASKKATSKKTASKKTTERS